MNAQPPVDRTIDANLVVALIPSDKETPILIGLFKAGCAVVEVRVSRGSYDAVLKTVLGQDS